MALTNKWGKRHNLQFFKEPLETGFKSESILNDSHVKITNSTSDNQISLFSPIEKNIFGVCDIIFTLSERLCLSKSGCGHFDRQSPAETTLLGLSMDNSSHLHL